MPIREIYKTEDEVRDEAKIILGFDEKEDNIRQGTGQIWRGRITDNYRKQYLRINST